MGIQIRAAFGKFKGGDPTCFHGLLKGGAELGITVVEQMLPGSLETTLRHG